MSDLSFTRSSYVKVLVLALIAGYVIFRIGENTFSWKKAPDQVTPPHEARQTGEKYAALLTGQESADRKIRALWELTANPAWYLTAGAADPLPLADDIARRARGYHAANNLPQAASHTKILLQWANCLLNASGPGTKTAHWLDVTALAIKATSACPGTLRYPAIQQLIKTLSQSLASPNTRMDDLLMEFSRSEIGEGPRNLLILANRNILKDSLATYLASSKSLKETKKMQLNITAKSWLFVCPLTEKLYRQSLEKLEPDEQKARNLLEEINSLLGSSPATIELPG